MLTAVPNPRWGSQANLLRLRKAMDMPARPGCFLVHSEWSAMKCSMFSLLELGILCSPEKSDDYLKIAPEKKYVNTAVCLCNSARV